MDETVARFLLLMRSMNNGFAVLKSRNEKGGTTWYYEQPSNSFVLPLLGFQLSKGILLDKDIERNKEIISIISKNVDNPCYFTPVKFGLGVKVYNQNDATVILDDVIKLISGKGFTTWFQIKVCYWKLKLRKNPLFKLFEGL